ncbi:MAG: DMT family transporter [Cyclobacteriaceae bacterium]|nr:DMT family transporter [Cyclobacteriaceae bacterium]
MRSNLKVHLALAFVSLLFGANYTVAKIVMPEHISAVGMIAFRVPVATLLFFIFHKLTGTSKTPAKSDLLRFFFSALFGVAINQIFFFKGISLTSPMLGSVIITSTPIFVLVVSYFLLKEKITWVKFVGIGLGACGAVLLITSQGTDFSDSTFTGNLFILLNAISYSIYLVLVKPLMQKYNALTVIKWIFLFGSFMVIPFGYSGLMAADWGNFDLGVWMSITYIIIGSTFLAYLLNLWSLKTVSPALVGYYIYLQPLFATLIAVVFREDEITLASILYSVMIFGGVFLVSYRKTTAKTN